MIPAQADIEIPLLEALAQLAQKEFVLARITRAFP